MLMFYARAGYLIVALVNLAPALGVTGKSQLEAMYGISLETPDLLLLMQHRALLFAVVGGLVVVAVLCPQLRLQAELAAAFSMGSFILLAYMADPGPRLVEIARIDIFALLVLALAAYLSRRANPSQMPAGYDGNKQGQPNTPTDK